MKKVIYLVLSLILLSTFLFGINYALHKNNQPQYPKIITTPPVTISPTTSSTFCRPDQLQGRVSIEPAAGNIYGTITLKNISSTPCTLSADKMISATASPEVKNIDLAYEGARSLQTITLKTGQTLYSQLHYPNGPQCSGMSNFTPVTLSYSYSPTDDLIFSTANGSKTITVATCQSSTEKTTIQLWYLADHPIIP